MSTSSQTLDQKVAIVVGGSRGLGRGVACALHSRGAKVVAVARDAATLAALSQEVAGVIAEAGDAADEATAERLCATYKPDVVIVCAGAPPVLAPLHEQSWEQFSTNWHVDTKAAFVWMRAAMRKPLAPGSHIIVVSSGAALKGSPTSGGYAGAKRAQWFIADYAANEIGRHKLGLRVHCLLPDLNPSTELGRAGIAAYAQRTGVSFEEFSKRFSPPLTPQVMGAGVVEILESPERFNQLAYRIGGAGLSPAT